MIRFFILLCAVIFLFPASGVSDDTGWDIYMSQSKVNKINLAGDSLWCATDGGIMLYNLTDSVFTSYFDGLGLRSTDIQAVTVDDENNIWASVKLNGIARIKNIGTNPEVNWYSAEYKLISDNVTCLANVGNEVYYGTEKGIGKFFEGIPSEESVLSENLDGYVIFDIFTVNDTILWVAGSNGVARFDRFTFDYDNFAIGIAQSLCSYNGNIYCATSNMIHIYEGGVWSPFGFPGGPPDPIVAVASGGGELYSITNRNLYHWDGSVWQRVDDLGMKTLFYAEYIIGNNVMLHTLEVDSGGKPWIGGSSATRPGRGINICSYDGGEWITKNPGGLNSNIIIRADMDPFGGVWISTEDFGICYNTGGDQWISYVDSLSYPRWNIAIICDSNGRLWNSALGLPLDMVELGERLAAGDDKWSRFTRAEEGISSRHINIVEDPRGNIWFLSDDDDTSEGYGIDIVNASATEWISINPGNSDMPGGNISDCVFDGSNVYLAINDYGVEVWHTGGFEWASLNNRSDDYWDTFVDGAYLPSEELNALEMSESGLWIATGGGLVKRLGNGSLIEYTSEGVVEEREILSNDVRDIEKDRLGNLWVATSAGLNVIGGDGEVKEAFTTYEYWKDNLQVTYPYSAISPLPDAKCNSLSFDPVNDKLWVGTANGLAGIDVTVSFGKKVPLSKLFIYPNPVYSSRGDAGLKISGISGTVEVKVYNLEGELVHEKKNISNGEEIWDILTINGYKVVSGVYIVEISNNEGSEFRKVAVVR